MKYGLLFMFFIFQGQLYSQTDGRDFKEVDAYVKSLGSLDSMTMGTISKIITGRFEDKTDKVRAIYYWIATNIDYDLKTARNLSTTKNSPTEVLLYRKAVGIGFASLFQDMCSSAGVRCLTADGFVKNSSEDIGENADELNHSWAVVQLGQSPETWYYVDPAWGSGFADNDLKVFTKSFTDAYFFSDKTIFNWQHYPDNEAWKLGSAPKNKSAFYNLPIIKQAAHDFRLKKFTPSDGKIREKLGNSMALIFHINTREKITKVSIATGERKKYQIKEVSYILLDGQLKINYKLNIEGSYPLTVFINGKELISYMMEVE